ncbi:MAG TPA: hypothetical protein PLI18_02895 [Pirellulaceae bacterium]|nr:hypothetical protein [Pirellulaceae bacterium]
MTTVRSSYGRSVRDAADARLFRRIARFAGITFVVLGALAASRGGAGERLPTANAPATPYRVLREPSELRTAAERSHGGGVERVPAEPKQRRTYAYGWFGVPPRTHHQLRSDWYGRSTRWSWE